MAPSHESPKLTGTRAMTEADLQRKRARDRRAQQAMRDRNKWTLQTQNQQITFLTQALEYETAQNGRLNGKVQSLENENESLRVQIAALRLKMLGAPGDGNSESTGSRSGARSSWQILPCNSQSTCLYDQLLQGFVDRTRHQRQSSVAPQNGAAYDQLPPFDVSPTGSSMSSYTTHASSPHALTLPKRLNLCPLLGTGMRSNDEASNSVVEIINYLDIQTLPKQVAVHFIISTLLQWLVSQDEQSYAHMPDWLRPVNSQLTTQHARFIDAVPWPEAREYLVDHPEITSDAFFAAYIPSFNIRWNYGHGSVISQPDGTESAYINPMFEEQVRQLQNWTVGDAFRNSFPELALIIDKYHEG